MIPDCGERSSSLTHLPVIVFGIDDQVVRPPQNENKHSMRTELKTKWRKKKKKKVLPCEEKADNPRKLIT